MFLVYTGNTRLNVNFCYPVARIWIPPLPDRVGGRFSVTQMNTLKKGRTIHNLDSYIRCANLLTDGFTKAQYGWQLCDVKNYWDNKAAILQETNELFNGRRVKNSSVRPTTHLTWAQFSLSTKFEVTKTIEKRKSAKQLKRKSRISDPQRIFALMGVREKISVKPITQKTVNEQPTTTEKHNADKKKLDQVYKLIDINVPRLRTMIPKILNLAEEASWDDATVADIAAGMNNVLKINCYSIEPTQLDIDLLYHSGASVNNQLYPNVHSANVPEHHNWGFLGINVKQLTPSSSIDLIKAQIRAIETGVWIIALDYMSQKDLKPNNSKQQEMWQRYMYAIVSDLEYLFDCLVVCNKFLPGKVKEALQKNYALAYVMNQMKWMVHCGKVYAAFIENNEWRKHIASRWHEYGLNEQATILHCINSNTKNAYTQALCKIGLHRLFVQIWVNYVTYWQTNLQYKNEFMHLWHLNENWQTDYNKYFEEASKKIASNATENIKSGSKRKELPGTAGEPPSKRQRTQAVSKTSDSFIEFLTQVLSTVGLKSAQQDTFIRTIKTLMPDFVEKQISMWNDAISKSTQGQIPETQQDKKTDDVNEDIDLNGNETPAKQNQDTELEGEDDKDDEDEDIDLNSNSNNSNSSQPSTVVSTGNTNDVDPAKPNLNNGTAN